MDKERFWRAKDVCDTQRMAEFLVEEQEALIAEEVPFLESPLASNDVLLLESSRMIAAGEPQRAVRYNNAWLRIAQTKKRTIWVDYLLLQGRAAYALQDFHTAAQFFEQYDALRSGDPETQFCYGNTLFHLGRVVEARRHYTNAMNILKNRGGQYAAHNFLLTLGASVQTGDAETDANLAQMPWGEMMEKLPPREIPELSPEETFDLPIFINCRDRLGCLQKLVTWLLDAGYRRIYLLDNASTYPPLRAWYGKICRDPRVTLVQLQENLGYQALWRSGILHQLDIQTPYVYTDPDTVPIEDCPKGLLARLYGLMRKYPFIDKVGPGLMMADVQESKDLDLSLERSYYHVPVEEQVFFAPCDTTFALYAPLYHYTNFMSLRTCGRLLVRHLPWYLDRDHLPEDEQYYVAHADSSSSFAKALK